MILQGLLILLLTIMLLLMITKQRNYTSSDIGMFTDNWIKAVTQDNDPKKVAGLFCHDANLVGTVSRTIRKGQDIERYFDYFAKLDGIRVLDKEYYITKVTDDVFINTAFVDWMWNDLPEPVTARMTFVFRNNCIYQLHSSVLPDFNVDLKKIAG